MIRAEFFPRWRQLFWAPFCGVVFLFLLSSIGFAQSAFDRSERSDRVVKNPRVGREVAREYFAQDQEYRERQPAQSSSAGGTVLMLGLGKYFSSTSYFWNCECKQEDVGGALLSVTYLFDHWKAFDWNLRVDYSEYRPNGSSARRLSLLPLLTFPKAESEFPLYFGFGAGGGIFTTQAEKESTLSLDYQLVVGTRFPFVWEGGGFFVEFGMKNHIHLLSDGQFNGTALRGGAIFVF